MLYLFKSERFHHLLTKSESNNDTITGFSDFDEFKDDILPNEIAEPPYV